ncbi:hypothetical protein HDU97_001698 [Phlyctochytrium planicorne]|nr:hypothetical protein HDU97_001698 [Phlyctochytrium planicorne]
MLKASAFLIVLLFGIASSQSIPEPCQKLLPSANNGFLASGDVLQSCYAAIPFNASSRADYVNVIKTSLQFHAALPYVKQKYPDVDPLKDMSAIINDPALTSRLDIAVQLREWSNKNGDRTLVSYGDTCFGYMWINQPFAIALPSGSTSGLPVIIDVVKGNLNPKDEAYLSAFWKSKSNLDVNKYKGYQVKSINGQDPYVLAKSIVFDREDYVSAAFTSYYVSNGTWLPAYGVLSRRNGPFATGFYAKPVTYELKGPSGDSVTLTDIPWAVLSGDFSSGDNPDDATWSSGFKKELDFLLNRCFGVKLPSPSASSGDFKIGASGAARHSNRLVGRDVTVPIPVVQGPKSPLIKVDDNTVVFTMGDGNYYLDETYVTPGFDFDQEVVASFKDLDAKFAEAKKSASRLIIDVSSTSGGCLGEILIKYLFSSTGKPMEFNLLLSPEVKEALSAAPTSDNFYLDPYITTNMAPVSGSNILTNTQSPNLPGSPTFSSHFTRTVCSKFEPFLLPNMTQLQGGWNPANVILVNDGYCSAECYDFYRALSQQFGVKTYIYGRNVNDIKTNLLQAYRYGVPARMFSSLSQSPLFDSVKNTDGSFRIVVPTYNVFEPGSSADAVPPIFENKDPDFRINLHSGDYPLGVWKAAAAMMPSAPPPPAAPGSTKPSGAAVGAQMSTVAAVVSFLAVFAL